MTNPQPQRTDVGGQMSEVRFPSSVFCLLSSVFCLPLSEDRCQKSDFHLLSSVFFLPSSVFRRGFSLVETVVSLFIVGIMLVAALSTVGASRLSQYKSSVGSRGQLLAESLMAEILRQDYQDPDGQSVFGCETGESSSTRADFDDVDDYHGWSSSPPVNKDGTPIPGLTGWNQSVTVQWVNPLDVTQVSLSETNVKKIIVTISYDNIQVVSLAGIKTASGL